MGQAYDFLLVYGKQEAMVEGVTISTGNFTSGNASVNVTMENNQANVRIIDLIIPDEYCDALTGD